MLAQIICPVLSSVRFERLERDRQKKVHQFLVGKVFFLETVTLNICIGALSNPFLFLASKLSKVFFLVISAGERQVHVHDRAGRMSPFI